MANVTFLGVNTYITGTSTSVLDGISLIHHATVSGLDDFGNSKLTSLSADNNTVTPDDRTATLMILTNNLGEETITGLAAGFGTWNSLSAVMTIANLSLPADLNGASPYDLANETEIQRLLKAALMGSDDFTISGVISEIWGDIGYQTGTVATVFGNDTIAIDAISAAIGYDRPVFYGDAKEVSADADVIAGNDIINASLAGIGVTIFGDYGTDYRVAPASASYGNDKIIGGNGNDILYGDLLSDRYGGNDILRGGGGSDKLYGGGGDDLFFGGEGFNKYYGGRGSDTVSLREFSAGGTSGQPIVQTVVDMRSKIFSSIENIVGHKFNSFGYDVIYGTNGDNIMRSGGAISVFHGRGGDDTLRGGAYFDRLSGGAGNDILVGNRNNDFFIFDSKLDPTTNVDRIKDFNHMQDSIWLDDRIMPGLSKTKVHVEVDAFGSPDEMKASYFYASFDGKAHDANDRILYDKDSGRLYFNPDGTGNEHRVLFAILKAHPVLDANDFYII